MLDVHGSYWFWPAWNDLDYQFSSIIKGVTVHSILDPFTWPDTGTEYVGGLKFWAIALDHDFSVPIGNYDMIEWAYGP